MEADDTPKVPTREEIERVSVIDPDALAHWFSLPLEGEIELHAVRADLDRLFIGLRYLAFAQGDTLAALQAFSHGFAHDAERHFISASSRHVQALEHITACTSGLMAKARAIG